MIVGVTGRAGAGKDTVADVLVKEHGFVKMGFADSLKSIVRETYDFTEEQLWGPSEMRDKPDHRYPREHGPWKETLEEYGKGPRCMCCGIRWSFNDPNEAGCFLTPRFALRLFGTEAGRTCFADTWVNKTMEAALAVTAPDTIQHFVEFDSGEPVGSVPLRAVALYDRSHGLKYTPWVDFDESKRPKGVVINDLRFDSEAQAIKRVGGFIVLKAGNESAPVTHSSEKGVDPKLIDFTLSWWEGDHPDLAGGLALEIEHMLHNFKIKEEKPT